MFVRVMQIKTIGGMVAMFIVALAALFDNCTHGQTGVLRPHVPNTANLREDSECAEARRFLESRGIRTTGKKHRYNPLTSQRAWDRAWGINRDSPGMSCDEILKRARELGWQSASARRRAAEERHARELAEERARAAGFERRFAHAFQAGDWSAVESEVRAYAGPHADEMLQQIRPAFDAAHARRPTEGGPSEPAKDEHPRRTPDGGVEVPRGNELNEENGTSEPVSKETEALQQPSNPEPIEAPMFPEFDQILRGIADGQLLGSAGNQLEAETTSADRQWRREQDQQAARDRLQRRRDAIDALASDSSSELNGFSMIDPANVVPPQVARAEQLTGGTQPGRFVHPAVDGVRQFGPSIDDIKSAASGQGGASSGSSLPSTFSQVFHEDPAAYSVPLEARDHGRELPGGSVPVAAVVSPDRSQIFEQRAYVYKPAESPDWHVAYTVRQHDVPRKLRDLPDEKFVVEANIWLLNATGGAPMGIPADNSPADDYLINVPVPKSTWSPNTHMREIPFPPGLAEIGFRPGGSNSIDLAVDGGPQIHLLPREVPRRRPPQRPR